MRLSLFLYRNKKRTGPRKQPKVGSTHEVLKEIEAENKESEVLGGPGRKKGDDDIGLQNLANESFD